MMPKRYEFIARERIRVVPKHDDKLMVTLRAQPVGPEARERDLQRDFQSPPSNAREPQPGALSLGSKRML